MATNQYFQNFTSIAEQRLIDDLIVESIKIYGVANFYCPRTIRNFDQLYGTDDVSTYDNNYELEMYIKNPENFTGDGRFLSKFGLEIRDEITFSVAKTSFENIVGRRTQLERPQEGDLILFSLNNKIYVIKYVQHESVFYQMGALQIYDLVCEQWEYSNETLNTGLPQIDGAQKKYSFDMDNFRILTQDQNPFFLTTEDDFPLVLENYILENQTIADNTFLKEQAPNIVDFSDIDPFSERTS